MHLFQNTRHGRVNYPSTIFLTIMLPTYFTLSTVYAFSLFHPGSASSLLEAKLLARGLQNRRTGIKIHIRALTSPPQTAIKSQPLLAVVHTTKSLFHTYGARARLPVSLDPVLPSDPVGQSFYFVALASCACVGLIGSALGGGWGGHLPLRRVLWTPTR